MTPDGKRLYLSGRYLDANGLPKNAIIHFQRTPAGDWRPLGVLAHVSDVGDIFHTNDGTPKLHIFTIGGDTTTIDLRELGIEHLAAPDRSH